MTHDQQATLEQLSEQVISSTELLSRIRQLEDLTGQLRGERDAARAEAKRLRAVVKQCLRALESADTALNYFGDEINAMDAATDEGIALTSPAFEVVPQAIAAAKAVEP